MSDHELLTAAAAISAMPPDLKAKFDALVLELRGDWAKLQVTLGTQKITAAAKQFVFASLGKLIDLIDGAVIANADKKAVVLAYAKTLFDTIVMPTVPFWLRGVVGIVEGWALDDLDALIEMFVALAHKKSPLPVPPPTPAPAT